MLSQLATFMLPWWARALAITFIFVSVFLLGQLHGERVAGEKHLDYISQQAAQTVKVAKAQQVVVTQTEVQYRDRIQKIYIKGEQIEKQVPIYITAADNAGCVINAGFVRSYNATWTSKPAGSSASADREPAGLSLAEVAETEAHNATSCLAWREQALGLRAFYAKLQLATNKPP